MAIPTSPEGPEDRRVIGKSTQALLWLERLRKSYVPPKLTQKQQDARAQVSEYLSRHNDPIPKSYVAEVAAELRDLDPTGVSFDASMLIALERRDLRPRAIWAELCERELPINITTHSLAEVWRPTSSNAAPNGLLDAINIEPISLDLAVIAGLSIGIVADKQNLPARRFVPKRPVPGLIEVDLQQEHLEHLALLEASVVPSLADAFVMSSAATRGDAVYSANYDECSLLSAHFFTFVKVIGI